MSAFEDDVEPLADEATSRGGTPFGGRSGRGAGASSSANGGPTSTRPLSPEPDEDFDTTDGRHSMWLVKVPRFLLEGWSKVDEDDKRLGTVRVYDPDHRGNQRMELLLPDAPEPAIPLPPSHPYLQTNYPRKYDLRLTSEQGNARVRNLYAFKERLEGADDDDDDDDLDSGTEDGNNKGKIRASDDRTGSSSKGKRVVTMVGTIANEAALKPQIAPSVMQTGNPQYGVGLTPEYREVLRKRRLEASKPRHSVKVLDQSDRAHTNMLTSGVTSHALGKSKSSFIANAQAEGVPGRAAAKGQHAERFARLPRNELLDILFDLFDQYPYWSIKGLRSKTQQPDAYLREVLMTIADLHRRGPYNGNWSVKPEFVEMRRQQERANKMATSALQDATTSAAGASGNGGDASLASATGQAQQQTNGSSTTATTNADDTSSSNQVKTEQNDDEDDLAMEDVA